jgi:hypothetical protein
MTVLTKIAWFHLTLGLLCLAGYLVIRAMVGPEPANAAIAILAPVGLTPVIFRRPLADEREVLINRRATTLGFALSYLLIVVACMAIWAVRHDTADPTIAVSNLPLLVMGAFWVSLVGRSVAVLLLERRTLDVSEV